MASWRASDMAVLYLVAYWASEGSAAMTSVEVLAWASNALVSPGTAASPISAAKTQHWVSGSPCGMPEVRMVGLNIGKVGWTRVAGGGSTMRVRMVREGCEARAAQHGGPRFQLQRPS